MYVAIVIVSVWLDQIIQGHKGFSPEVSFSSPCIRMPSFAWWDGNPPANFKAINLN